MMTRFSAAAAAAISSFAILAPAHAVIIGAGTTIPSGEVIINFNNTGLDWVYAGPIAPNEFGPGNIQPATYRATEGWRIATASEWASRPEWFDFIRPGEAVDAINGYRDHAKYRFTSEYWSDFSHVDIEDYSTGNLTDGVNGVTSGVPETIYVRTSALAGVVPEPATWALMIVGLGAVGGAMRRRLLVTAKIRFA